ncbi:MAG: hypothetical protein LBD11_07470 [Candidatus Peribacteria bacterium]|jgi:hypothetical protein|nr:hypothetical protein [Candidatus Peribacteria bacterium]
MQSFYLTKYLASPIFLAELPKKQLPYDAILSDIAYTESPIPLYTVANKPANQALLPYRAQALSQAKHPLIILDQLPLSSIRPLLEKFSSSSLTIINLYTGMGSLGRKLAPEYEDFSNFPRDIAKYEPIDAVNFFTILEQPHSKYLRIPHQHFPESIFSTEEIGIIDAQMLQSLEVLSLKGYGYTGNTGTLIATGANFPLALQLGDYLNEQEKPMDLFILSKLTINFTEEIKSSLHQSKKLYFLIDHLPSQAMKNFLQQTLTASGVHGVEVHVLTPKYEKLTTIFDEFSAEQADFDTRGLSQRL